MAVNYNNVKIHVSHLQKNFGKLEVLKDITTDIYEGEVVVILGPSGCGKSTFLRCINRLEDITAGDMVVDGNHMDDKKININKARENVGMVFQHFNLFNNLNVIDNLTLAPIQVKKMKMDEAKELAMKMLGKVGLEDKAQAYPSMLSGGQKQRLSLARVFLKNPPILIFDEATSALDNESEKIVQDSLEHLAKNRTTLVIAHRLSTIRNAKRILVLTEDGIAEEGTHDELMAKNGVYANFYHIQGVTA